MSISILTLFTIFPLYMYGNFTSYRGLIEGECNDGACQLSFSEVLNSAGALSTSNIAIKNPLYLALSSRPWRATLSIQTSSISNDGAHPIGSTTTMTLSELFSLQTRFPSCVATNSAHFYANITTQTRTRTVKIHSITAGSVCSGSTGRLPLYTNASTIYTMVSSGSRQVSASGLSIYSTSGANYLRPQRL